MFPGSDLHFYQTCTMLSIFRMIQIKTCRLMNTCASSTLSQTEMLSLCCKYPPGIVNTCASHQTPCLLCLWYSLIDMRLVALYAIITVVEAVPLCPSRTRIVFPFMIPAFSYRYFSPVRSRHHQHQKPALFCPYEQTCTQPSSL